MFKALSFQFDFLAFTVNWSIIVKKYTQVCAKNLITYDGC